MQIRDLGQLDGPVLLFGGPYSNLQATRAMRAEAQRRGIAPAACICTGDVVAYCGDAAATVAEIPAGRWTVQSVMRRNLDAPSIGGGEGTAYSRATTVEIDPAAPSRVELTIDRIVPGRAFRETQRIRLVEVRSELLSDFHGRDVTMRAAVILPKGHREGDDRRYPAYYWITGFGGDHFAAPMLRHRWDSTASADSPDWKYSSAVSPSAKSMTSKPSSARFRPRDSLNRSSSSTRTTRL